MKLKLTELFIYSAGGLLLAAALIRFIVAVSDAQVMAIPEPLLGIPLRYAVLLIGGIESFVALVCLFGKRVGFQLGLLAWLAINYSIYRIWLFWIHGNLQATCIGSLMDPLHLSRGLTGTVIILMPLYLLAGSCVVAYWIRLEARKIQIARFIKMSCPVCGGHIRFAHQNLGQKMPCPHCRKDLTLRKPDLLKISCFFCQGRIEFPSHAIGEKMPCPHCKMDITLKELT